MGAREGRGSSDAPSPGWARGGAARIPRRWPEFPSTQCAQTRMKREVQKQKRTILRHKQVQNYKHTHTHTLTPRRPTTARTHTRARTHATTRTNFSREEQYTEMPPPPLPIPSTTLCPFLKNKNKNLATTQQRTVRTFE